MPRQAKLRNKKPGARAGFRVRHAAFTAIHAVMKTPLIPRVKLFLQALSRNRSRALSTQPTAIFRVSLTFASPIWCSRAMRRAGHFAP